MRHIRLIWHDNTARVRADKIESYKVGDTKKEKGWTWTLIEIQEAER